MSKRLADRRRRIMIGAGGIGCAAILAGLSGYWPAASAGERSAVAPTLVSVTAGKPSEYAFKLSKASSLPWTAATKSSVVTFKVMNAGVLSHAFKVCTEPLEGALVNACRGVGTKTLKPGQSASLTLTFRTRGTFEYLSPVSGQAAKGMKGMLGIGVALAKTTTTTPKPTPPRTTTTPSSTPTTPSSPSTPTNPLPPGNAAAGAVVWTSAGCGSCHSFGSVKGNIGADLNASHQGTFEPLTPTQIANLIEFVNSQ